eukprot:m.899387 g.899387  ORF g.899387 m.899387 type:complete len:67 (+) comp23680_c0_seq6:1576-1776(+)
MVPLGPTEHLVTKTFNDSGEDVYTTYEVDTAVRQLNRAETNVAKLVPRISNPFPACATVRCEKKKK